MFKPAAVARDAPAPGKADPLIIAGITITHPGKALFRDASGKVAATKLDLARYLADVGPVMARYAANRFISLLRAPRGAEGQGFFQRHPQAGFTQYWKTGQLADDDNHDAYLYFTDPRALVEAAQMDTLEFHIWGSQADHPDRPDRIVFDLDPAPEVGFAAVKQGALDVRTVLDALGLAALPMLSGGKGIHVVVPVEPRNDWPTVKRFSADVATRLSTAEPDRYVATMAKTKRTGRIFIDHFRNDRTASAVAPFSPRNRAGTPVAWPLTWDDLKDVGSASAVSMAQALQRLQSSGDPWQGYDEIKQSLTAKMIAAVAVKT
ncbi:MAG: non-homologous end-joining DNA ligase [Acidiphilium sp.]|nr:non-homologous end-joining DNA ligase [Acidiphilium sp.]MDD4936695.1 non-homologous end-joining DNA ligase [Acidiphilium sp.]